MQGASVQANEQERKAEQEKQTATDAIRKAVEHDLRHTYVYSKAAFVMLLAAKASPLLIAAAGHASQTKEPSKRQRRVANPSKYRAPTQAQAYPMQKAGRRLIFEEQVAVHF